MEEIMAGYVLLQHPEWLINSDRSPEYLLYTLLVIGVLIIIVRIIDLFLGKSK
jgi:hypothetical protein